MNNSDEYEIWNKVILKFVAGTLPLGWAESALRS